jgi:4-hydroxybenzoate polyprenyltransferase
MTSARASIPLTSAPGGSVAARFRIADILILSWIPLPLLKHASSVAEGVLFVVTIFAYNYLMFSFNDYMDSPHDYHDAGKRARNPFLSERYKKLAISLMVLSGVVLLGVGAFDLPHIYLNVALLLIAINYSAGVRAKNKPFLDVVIHGFWILGMIVYGIAFFEIALTSQEIAFLYEYFIISTALEISQGLRDYEVDKQTNERTTVVHIGPKATKLLYAVLVIGFALVTPLLITNPWLRFLPLVFVPLLFFTRQETFDQRALVINSMSLYAAIAYLA